VPLVSVILIVIVIVSVAWSCFRGARQLYAHVIDRLGDLLGLDLARQPLSAPSTRILR
jgi:hypothetical protein